MLRAATWHRHEAFERLPFVAALIEGTLPRESYVGQLRGLAVIIAALEQSIARMALPVSQEACLLLRRRFDLLCADLVHFSPLMVPDVMPAVRDALDCARAIRETPAGSAGRLFGCLYVLQGTVKGNRVHLPDIIRCFGLRECRGAEFYSGCGDDSEERWSEFRDLMARASDGAGADAEQGACWMYDTLERFHTALFPLPEGELGFAAVGLNPEAGDHPVPQDPALLEAALRAGRRCREEFSYFERRYGERGRRFTDSDVAWLGTMAAGPAEAVHGQVQWLGRILSLRGMPQFLLERQLAILSGEFAATGAFEQGAVLAEASDVLRRQRCCLLDQDAFDVMCRRLSQAMTSTAAREFRDLPVILAAARLDALAGMPECAASLLAWLDERSILTGDEQSVIASLLDSMRSSI